MFLESLRLRHYGKHEHLQICFGNKNILYGSDQSGKSSLLQAIFLFVESQNRLTQPLDFVKTKQEYATVEAVFKTEQQSFKIKALLQNALAFFLDERRVDLDKLPALKIVFFTSENALALNQQARKNFLQTATKQFFAFLNVIFVQLNADLLFWKQQIAKKQFQENAYYLDLVQKTETKIAKNLYQVSLKQQELITNLNQRVAFLRKQHPTQSKKTFALKFKTKIKTTTEVDFVVRLKKLLFDLRKTATNLTLDYFYNDFDFVFSDSKTTFKENLFATALVQIAFGQLLELQPQKAVLFLVDDFHVFDLPTQKFIWKLVSASSQCIIALNQQTWKTWDINEGVLLHSLE